MTPHLPANKPYFPETDRAEIAAEMVKILEGGRLTQGPWIARFEEAFARYAGTAHAVATNSGTSALEILLRYFQVEGGEVIVPTNTFLSSGNAVIFAGGTPVLADISPATLCLDPQEIIRKLTPHTRGVMLVHIAGLITPDLEAIRRICRERELFLIEDAAHAPGAALNGQPAGSLADGGAFSFYPTKPMTTGEGGMITTNDPACADFARSLRCHGIAIGEENRGENKNLLLRLGYNWRMSEIQALVGYYQLQRLDEALDKRGQIARLYEVALNGIPGLRRFPCPEHTRHSYYKFPLLLEKPFLREAVARSLAGDFGIQSGSIYWPPCHLQPFYRERFGYRPGDFPVAEDILERTIALPIYPEMCAEDVERVAGAFRQILQNRDAFGRGE